MDLSFEFEACRRLPFADASLRLLHFALDEAFLNTIFEQHRGRSYKKIIAFPTFVHLIADTLLERSPSAHQTFRKAQDDGTLEASIVAAYGKLKRIPVPLSQAFFAQASQRLDTVALPDVHSLPHSLNEFRILAFDGKKIKHLAKRIQAFRGLNGTILGGKLLAIQDLGSGRAVAFEATVEGDAADNPLVPGAVDQVRAGPDSRPRVWIGDRAFCDYITPRLLSEGTDHFVIRYHTKCTFVADTTKPAQMGIDANGLKYREEWGWLGPEKEKRRMLVRQITLTRPGEDKLVVVTSLLDGGKYPASDVLSLYHRRWGIEAMFLDVTQTFDLRHLISSSPQATVFQAGFCFLLYNITCVVRGYVAADAKVKPSEVSGKLLFEEMVQDLIAWSRLMDEQLTMAVLAETPLASAWAMQKYLKQVLSGVWEERLRKSKPQRRSAKSAPRAYLKGGYSSASKILRGEHKEVPLNRNQRAKADAVPG